MLPVILWSDFFFWSLLIIGTGLVIYQYKRQLLFRQGVWRLIKDPVAVICVLIISMFFFIAIIDSIHFRLAMPEDNLHKQSSEIIYEAEPISLLDYWLHDIRENKEITYSAPFALRSFTKTTEETAAGVKRDYLRLKYAGKRLSDESQRIEDIIYTVLIASFLSFISWFVLVGIVIYIAAQIKKSSFLECSIQIWKGDTNFAWKTFFIMLGVLTGGASIIAALSQDYHVLGTDAVGQDVLYLALKSIRCSLLIGTLPTIVMLPIAIWLGLIAGYFRGFADDTIQYIYTTLNSIPGVLLIAAAVLMMQVIIDSHPSWFQTSLQRADIRLMALCIILGATGWTALCRLLRAETMKLRELEFVQAAEAFNVPKYKIVTTHLLPNVFHLILISVVMDFSALVLAEAVLSYVGIGVDPAMTSFGTMINMARMEMSREPVIWWTLLTAFIFLFVLVLSTNILADCIQTAFDARTRMNSRSAIIDKLREVKTQWWKKMS